jgi:hypothetical protein
MWVRVGVFTVENKSMINYVSVDRFLLTSANRVSASDLPLTKLPIAISSNASSTLSILSRQLGESAVRADARDRTLTRAHMGAEAERLINQIFGDVYQSAKHLHNEERPDTSDPELLERARLATDYVVRSDQHNRSVRNPFAGLTRDQLNLIVYDETGPYTINERRAAFYAVSDIESQWNKRVMRIYDQEAAENIVNRPGFCREVLSHYRSLSAIEQAQYADDYEMKLEARINEKQEGVKGNDKLFTLFELLEIMLRSKKPNGPRDEGADNESLATSASGAASSITTNN